MREKSEVSFLFLISNEERASAYLSGPVRCKLAQDSQESCLKFTS